MKEMSINLSQLANFFSAWLTCNETWKEANEDRINEMLVNLPHGSGIDNGVKFDWENSKPNKLIFSLEFHHLNEGGFYDGWTQHKIILTPDFISGYDMRITGRNRNDIKDYLCDVFNEIFYADSVSENEPDSAR